VGLPHPRLGAVVAAVLADGAALERARAAARAELSPAQRPRSWFTLPAPPLTAAGKVDRAALAGLAAAGIDPPPAAALADPAHLPAGMSPALDAAGHVVGHSPN
jgi:acyl-CoA synthetase (AMP-forming)/AMP-acid ligase II